MEKTNKLHAIDRSLFLRVNREIKMSVELGTYNAEEIGRHYHLSPESVRAIRRAGSWPQFGRNKKARREREVQLAIERAEERAAKRDAQRAAQAELDLEKGLRDMPLGLHLQPAQAPRMLKPRRRSLLSLFRRGR